MGNTRFNWLEVKPHQYLIRQNLDDIEYLKTFLPLKQEIELMPDLLIRVLMLFKLDYTEHISLLCKVSLIQHNATLVAHDARLTTNEPKLHQIQQNC